MLIHVYCFLSTKIAGTPYIYNPYYCMVFIEFPLIGIKQTPCRVNLFKLVCKYIGAVAVRVVWVLRVPCCYLWKMENTLSLCFTINILIVTTHNFLFQFFLKEISLYKYLIFICYIDFSLTTSSIMTFFSVAWSHMLSSSNLLLLAQLETK